MQQLSKHLFLQCKPPCCCIYIHHPTCSAVSAVKICGAASRYFAINHTHSLQNNTQAFHGAVRFIIIARPYLSAYSRGSRHCVAHLSQSAPAPLPPLPGPPDALQFGPQAHISPRRPAVLGPADICHSAWPV